MHIIKHSFFSVLEQVSQQNAGSHVDPWNKLGHPAPLHEGIDVSYHADSLQNVISLQNIGYCVS